MIPIIISDASCLIALDRINRLEILNKVFSEIITTPEVKAEFVKELPAWIKIRAVKDRIKINELSHIVDLGEASAIALAIETSRSILIIDEKKGRKTASDLGLPIIGTVKVILLAKQKAIIPEIKPIILELERNNFRFSKALIKKALTEANEA